MKTSRTNFFQMSIVIALVIAVAVVLFLIWRYGKSQPVLISREEAIRQAIEACNPGYGFQPVEPPTEFETEITTYEEAFGGFAPIASKAHRPVYVITMKNGKWILVGGPPTESNPDPSQPTPAPNYEKECTQIIDAQTGEWLSFPIE